ncbi:MAG: hypothetical protein K0V04_35060 [Deltaproteobacteria bacterium]|nr:hypothetical protein [Deltaproteobacteria bacterium]
MASHHSPANGGDTVVPREPKPAPKPVVEPGPEPEPQPEGCAEGGSPWSGKAVGCSYEHGGCCYESAAHACAAAGCPGAHCIVLESYPAQISCDG